MENNEHEPMSDETPAETITLANEIGRQRFVLANAEDEIAFQLAINQQIGAENERLRAENAAMRAIVAAVARTDIEVSIDGDLACPFCERWIGPKLPHADDCTVLAARAFFAAHPATGEGE